MHLELVALGPRRERVIALLPSGAVLDVIDVEAAVAVVRTRDVTVVLCELADHDLAVTVRRLRDAGGPPIVAITRDGDPEAAPGALRAGAHEVLPGTRATADCIAWAVELAGHRARLARSATTIDTALGAMRGIVWSWDRAGDGRVERSAGLSELIGLAPTALPPTPEAWTALIHPDDLTQLWADAAALPTDAREYAAEYRVRHAEGHWVDVWERTRVERDPQGEIERMHGFTTDVTTRRAAERELQRVADNSPDVIARFDRALRHTFVNATASRAAGVPRADLLGKTNRELGMPPELCDLWDPAMNAVFATGEAREISFTFGQGAAAQHYSNRLVPEFGADGQVESVLAIGQNVTALVSARDDVAAALARTEDALAHARAVSDLTPGIVWACAADGTPDYASERWYQLTGVPRHVPIAQAFEEMVHPDDAPRVAAAWEAALASRRPLEVELRLRAAAGRYRWFLARATPQLGPDHAVTRWFGLSLDIEDRKVMEAALERSLRLSDMLVAVLGHDLRSPLSAIRTGVEIARAGLPPARLAPVLVRVVSSVDRMARMIDQLLDVTRIRTAGGLELQCRRVDLAAVCQGALEELGDRASASTLGVHGDPTGIWDADRISQVISNLLGNAHEHAPPRTAVQVTVDGGSPDEVILTVRNAGGIPPELLPVLFAPFRGTVVGQRARGLGLGLYITQQVVDAHHGTISVESTDAAGTTFTVRLPRVTTTQDRRVSLG